MLGRMGRGGVLEVERDLDRLRPDLRRFRLHQTFRWSFDRPVTDLVHRLVVVPPARHGDQQLVLGAVRVSDDDAVLRWETRLDGTRCVEVRLARVDRELVVGVDVVVDRGHPVQLLPLDALGNPALVAPTRLTRPDAALRRLARRLGRGGDVLVTADALCAEVHDRIAHRPGGTGSGVGAAQAHETGSGDRREQAHVLLALCRELGLPSRYVCGHLAGEARPHAWVEVLVQDGPGVRAVAFDPGHGRRADGRYLTIATGLDAQDVRPTSGGFAGSARGVLTCERDLVVTPLVLPGQPDTQGGFLAAISTTFPASPLACR
jgi:transglutaminase-like putative cysteine protease